MLFMQKLVLPENSGRKEYSLTNTVFISDMHIKGRHFMLFLSRLPYALHTDYVSKSFILIPSELFVCLFVCLPHHAVCEILLTRSRIQPVLPCSESAGS